MENKDIRQYLHYYLNCDCLCKKSNYHLVHNLSIHNGERFKLTVRVLASLEGQSTAIVKPILRGLEDMELEDLLLIHSIPKDSEIIKKRDCGNYIEWEFRYRNVDPKRNNADGYSYSSTATSKINLLLKDGNIFHHFLSKGYDLFNLIPEGLAIDRKTINP